jgi:hypothetical protein
MIGFDQFFIPRRIKPLLPKRSDDQLNYGQASKKIDDQKNTKGGDCFHSGKI